LPIQTILFDADGVIQRPTEHRRAAWQRLLGSGRNVDEFVAAVFAAERPACEGRIEFIGAFSDLLAAWSCQGTLQDALAVWTMIQPDAAIVQLVQGLRRSGINCCLATNQEHHRAAYMSEQLGYHGLFDSEFYSCRMGVAKPAAAYFRSIVDALGISPADALFLDDQEANVRSAREVGLNAVQFVVDSGAPQMARTLADFGIQVV